MDDHAFLMGAASAMAHRSLSCCVHRRKHQDRTALNDKVVDLRAVLKEQKRPHHRSLP